LASRLAGRRASHASEETRNAPLHARRPRRRPGQSLITARMKRALRRQWLPFLVFAALIAAVTIAYFHYVAQHVLWFATLQGVTIGLGAALVFVLVREVGRNTITSLTSLNRHRGYAVLGAAPELTDRVLRELAPDQRSPLGALAYLPASPFATAYRDLQGQIPDGSIVAMLSSVSGEGATTASVCIVASATQQGRSAIVVDCDVRRRSLTKAFGVETHLGLMEACTAPDAWRSFVEHEAETGLNFMPIGKVSNVWQPLAERPGLAGLLEQLREAYDFVVLDCPPAFTADGVSLSRLVDQSIVVAAWDRTPLDIIRRSMRQVQAGERPAGIYVNRVPPDYRFGRLRPD